MRAPRSMLAAALLCALPAVASAQPAIKGGVSHADVSNSGVLPGELGPRTGITIGASFATAPGVFGLGLEALYSQRGVEGTLLSSSRELDYIDVPIFLRVMVPTPGVAPYAYAGPQLSFELRCRAGPNPCPDTGRPGTTYAGVIGAGVKLGGALYLEGRYVYGLSDLELSTVSDSESYEDRSFVVLLGVGW